MILSIGCSRSLPHDETLVEIDSLCDTHPDMAVSMLDSIDKKALGEADRHYHDLLCIKTRDKAYTAHTSDSLILDVVDYYSSHPDKKLYPEALYYAGRVYADMDSALKAMRYFDEALEQLADDDVNLKLKVRVLSQAGRILDNLELLDLATPYIDKSIGICKELNDSLNVVYDCMLMIQSYLNNSDPATARVYLDEATAYSEALPECDKAWFQVVTAAVLFAERDTEAALKTIRPHVHDVDSICLNYALANAAEIYLKAGITDTAYMYAKELVESGYTNNRRVGYQLLVTDALSDTLSPESLRTYLTGYRKSVDNQVQINATASEMIKKMYGMKDEEHRLSYVRNASAIIVMLLAGIACTYIIYIRRRKKLIETFATPQTSSQTEELPETEAASDAKGTTAIPQPSSQTEESHEAEAASDAEGTTAIPQPPSQTEESHKTEAASDAEETTAIPQPSSQTEESHETEVASDAEDSQVCIANANINKRDELREKLLTELAGRHDILVSDAILKSPVYRLIVKKIESGSTIQYQTEIWDNLKKAVIDDAPDFLTNLSILTADKFTNTNLQTALLLRCGFSNRQMTILLGITRAAVSDRKLSLIHISEPTRH